MVTFSLYNVNRTVFVGLRVGGLSHSISFHDNALCLMHCVMLLLYTVVVVQGEATMIEIMGDEDMMRGTQAMVQEEDMMIETRAMAGEKEGIKVTVLRTERDMIILNT